MKRALVAFLLVVAASAAADPSAPARAPKPRAAPHKPPATATIVVGTEKPQPKVLIVHGSERAVVGRPKMDDRLQGLPHHLH